MKLSINVGEESDYVRSRRIILETLLECLDGCIEDVQMYDPDESGPLIPMINANTFKARIEEKLWRMKQ